jgi:hypothetical protein
MKYHFISYMVEAGRIKLTYCASEDMVVDMLTNIKQLGDWLELVNLIAESEECWR